MKEHMEETMKECLNDYRRIRIEPVAAYVCVSTQEQKRHGLSLDAQKMKLSKYAKEHNMKIVEWYMDEVFLLENLFVIVQNFNE